VSGFSTYLEAAILNATLRGVAFPATTANVYVALFVGDPMDDGSGAELTFVGSPGYARVAVANAGWDSLTVGVSGTTTSNLNDVEFLTATGNWEGPITHFAIFDALTVGNLLFSGALDSSRTIEEGDVFRFLAGELVVEVN
jgi:hypothetical protein